MIGAKAGTPKSAILTPPYDIARPLWSASGPIGDVRALAQTFLQTCLRRAQQTMDFGQRRVRVIVVIHQTMLAQTIAANFIENFFGARKTNSTCPGLEDMSGCPVC